MFARSPMLAFRGAGGGGAALRPQDVSAMSLWTGNSGAGTPRAIPAGFQPDLVLLLNRSASSNRSLADSIRGATKYLFTNSAQAEFSPGSPYISAFTSTGFTMPTDSAYNNQDILYAALALKKVPGLLDIIRYSGDGTAGRALPHGLGAVPGMVWIKKISTASTAPTWPVWHNGLNAQEFLSLQSTNPAAASANIFNQPPDASNIYLGSSNPNINAAGETYMAFVFAHDPSAGGVIQCGTGNVTLPWAPRVVLFKDAGAATDWFLEDAARGFASSGSAPAHSLTTTSPETSSSALAVSGNTLTFSGMTKPIWMAIRAPTA